MFDQVTIELGATFTSDSFCWYALRARASSFANDLFSPEELFLSVEFQQLENVKVFVQQASSLKDLQEKLKDGSQGTVIREVDLKSGQNINISIGSSGASASTLYVSVVPEHTQTVSSFRLKFRVRLFYRSWDYLQQAPATALRGLLRECKRKRKLLNEPDSIDCEQLVLALRNKVDPQQLQSEHSNDMSKLRRMRFRESLPERDRFRKPQRLLNILSVYTIIFVIAYALCNQKRRR